MLLTELKSPAIRRRELLPRRANLNIADPAARTGLGRLCNGYRLRYDTSTNGDPAWVEPETGLRFAHARVVEHPDTALLTSLSDAQWRALIPVGMKVLAWESARPTLAGHTRTLQSLERLGLAQPWNAKGALPTLYVPTPYGAQIAKLVAIHERTVDHLEQGAVVINRG